MAVLGRAGIPTGIRRIIRQLYADCDSLLLFSGEVVVGEMPITSGIKQRCPMSGSLFALSVDPFLRRLLTRSLVGLSRLMAYADDLAIAHGLGRFASHHARVPSVVPRIRLEP